MASALHSAARSGDTKALMAAVAADADINEKDNLQRTALHLAAWSGQTDFVRLLLAHGCNATATAMDDMNALHFAAQKGHTEIARHLLNAGVHVNSRTRKGLTALALAAQNGHTEVVKLLLQRKANAGVTNQKGQTPADMAKTDEIRALLLEAASAPAVPHEGEPDGEPGHARQNARKARGAQKGGRVKMQADTGPQQEPEGHGGDGEEVAVAIGPPERPPQAVPAQGKEPDEQATQHEQAGDAPIVTAEQPPSKKQRTGLSFGEEDP